MKRQRMTKIASESNLQSIQADVNFNVSWLNGSYVWPTYFLVLIALRLFNLYFLSTWLSSDWQWTLTFIVHGVFSFWALHWMRGSPVGDEQGEHIHETMWEQIDNGVPWTKSRKIFMITPIVLFLICSHFTDYDKTHLGINSVILAILLVAKLPEMHLVRLFGINKAPVDDSDRD